MKLSELVRQAQRILEDNGDAEIFYEDNEGTGDRIERIDFDLNRHIVALRSDP